MCLQENDLGWIAGCVPGKLNCQSFSVVRFWNVNAQLRLQTGERWQLKVLLVRDAVISCLISVWCFVSSGWQ